jgi:hypothetical protein
MSIPSSFRTFIKFYSFLHVAKECAIVEKST